jgi:hypothetical protein
MSIFAIIENNIVVDIIVAESVEIATEVTGKKCVLSTENNPAIIGLGYDGVTFEQPIEKDIPIE